jgi:NADH-quinone oxidoreductase subunit M
MLSLIGLIAIYVKSGAHSFDLITLRETLAANPLRVSVQKNIFGLLMFGFGILVSLWPFHTWAPLGYGAAPSSAAMLHAGVLKKFGLYGLIQIALPLLPVGAGWWAWKLALLAAFGNVLVVGLITMAQRDLKQMIGYSSVMHMGYCFLGIACLGARRRRRGAADGRARPVGGAAVPAGDQHPPPHAHLRPGRDGRAGAEDAGARGVLRRRHHGQHRPARLRQFLGRAHHLRRALEFLPWITAVAVAGVVISAVYGLRAAARVFFGPPSAALTQVMAEHPPADMGWGERLPALILLAALLLFGFFPRLLSETVDQALSQPAETPAALVHFNR